MGILKKIEEVVSGVDKNYSDKRDAVKRLVDESTPELDYFVLLAFSAVIVTLGLILNSTSVVIGGMLLTPILTPLLALGLGFVTFNASSLARSAWAVFRSIVFVLLIAYVTAEFVGEIDLTNNEISQRVIPTWLYVHIALLSGLAATYSWAKPKLSAALPGIAIAVALLPPLCVTGIALSVGDSEIMHGSFNLFLVNMVGIVVSSVFVFTILGFERLKKVEEREIKTVESSSGN